MLVQLILKQPCYHIVKIKAYLSKLKGRQVSLSEHHPNQLLVISSSLEAPIMTGNIHAPRTYFMRGSSGPQLFFISDDTE